MAESGANLILIYGLIDPRTACLRYVGQSKRLGRRPGRPASRPVGASGTIVEWIQRRAGNLTVDGTFGTKTKTRIKELPGAVRDRF